MADFGLFFYIHSSLPLPLPPFSLPPFLSFKITPSVLSDFSSMLMSKHERVLLALITDLSLIHERGERPRRRRGCVTARWLRDAPSSGGGHDTTTNSDRGPRRREWGLNVADYSAPARAPAAPGPRLRIPGLWIHNYLYIKVQKHTNGFG